MASDPFGPMPSLTEPPREEDHRVPAEEFASVGDPDGLPSDALLRDQDSIPTQLVEGDRTADIALGQREVVQRAEQEAALKQAATAWAGDDEFVSASVELLMHKPSHTPPGYDLENQVAYIQSVIPLQALEQAPFPANRASEALGILIDTFDKSVPPGILGRITQVLCGTPVNDPVTLVMTMRQLYSIHHPDLDFENGPSEMALFWQQIPDLDPPDHSDVFGDYDSAERALKQTFPVLQEYEHTQLLIDMTIILMGGTNQIPPELFGEMVNQARMLQAAADRTMAPTILDDTHQPKDLIFHRDEGGERLLSEEEIEALNEATRRPLDDGRTLDQDEWDVPLPPGYDPFPEPDYLGRHTLPGQAAPEIEKTSGNSAVPGWLLAILIGLILSFFAVVAAYLLINDDVQDQRISQVESYVRNIGERNAELWNRYLVSEGTVTTLSRERQLALEQRDMALMSADQWSRALEDAGDSAKSLDKQLERRLKLELDQVATKAERALQGQARLMEALSAGTMSSDLLTSIVHENQCPSSPSPGGRRFVCQIGGKHWSFTCSGTSWNNATDCQRMN